MFIFGFIVGVVLTIAVCYNNFYFPKLLSDSILNKLSELVDYIDRRWG